MDHPGLDEAVFEKMKEIHERSRHWIRLSQEANSGYDVEEAVAKPESTDAERPWGWNKG